MPTTRSHFSFEQIEKVLQKLAYKIALDAVTTLEHGRVCINISGTRIRDVDTDEYCIRFYANHVFFNKKNQNMWAFDVERKVYLTSNHCSKISFYAPEGKREEREKSIIEFIDKIMAEASIKPKPRFSLSDMKNE